MDGFTIFDKDYHEINAEGRRVLRNVDVSGTIVPEYALQAFAPALPAYFGFKCPRLPGRECNYLRIAGGPADDGKRPKWT